ncbi:formylmethanofuran dehydrogenase subunit B [uncultured Thiodictyon sp.]|jgi:formylmethanofuran dehydrogenase subunit B|uniref:formylmethanofuran dehydrogenase subunit B n=1 Tax=uncultured Thiodictyon sp. TaxID=1846217 RepID=UPI0025E131E4|nr:formylmethanofuran dehydrogenase subunit B [uncultured Thiodictyon sp.]
MWTSDPAQTPGNLTCPFCGLACDDLSVAPGPADAGLVLVNGCQTARGAFAGAMAAGPGTALIKGQPVSLEAALAHAAGLLAAARAPLFGGLVTDVNGMRAVLELADRCGALLDHVGADALFRNLLVLQDGGWMTATLTEVRNRADLILILGREVPHRFPRLCERVLLPPEALFSPPGERRLVLLGPAEPGPLPAEFAAANPTLIPVALADLAGVGALLRGLIAGRPVRADAIPGVAGAQLKQLAGWLCGARYAVVTWAAGELAFPHAELTVQAFVELVRDLNRTTRAAALPLAGTLGDLTANQVCTWQTGYPLRSGRQQGRSCYEPLLYRHQDLLAQGQSDLLLWVQALPAANPAATPAAKCPTIVLGYPGLACGRVPEVFIPVGLPGIDHPGHWYRTDAVCPLPLGQVRDLGLASVAGVIGKLSERLGATAE